MLRIEVVAYNGQSPLVTHSSEFDERGGNIGRADGNAMVLPDPERIVSRVHASIHYRAGAFVIRDESSSNPLYVNGSQLGNGSEAVLRSGDEIRIGLYLLRASLDPAEVGKSVSNVPGGSQSDNPFADLLTPAPAREPTRPPARAVDPASSRPQSRSSIVEPRGDASSRIPEDFNPFDPVPAAPKSTPSLPNDFELGLENFGGKRSIDEVFDLSRSPGAGALARPTEGVGNAAFRSAAVDPLPGIGDSDPEPLLGSAQRDDAGAIYSNFQFPRSRVDPARVIPVSPEASPPRQTVPVESTPDDPSGSESDARQSMDSGEGIPAVPRSELPVGTPPGSSPAQHAAPNEPPARAQVVSTPQASAPRSHAEADELLREFLAGAGVPDLEMTTPLTPRLMHMIGQLLYESTRGTLDLLRARALLKHEMRASMTMIAERENNPLKFSPTVDAAMKHLLAPPGQGYMTPLRAMRDAYDDLRAHEFGFMAGMRAALAGVLARFSPEQLERRLTEGTVLDRLIPANRRAKQWDVFVSLYADLSREAEDDFHALFGKEFLRAYAAQIAKLEQDEGAPRGQSKTAGSPE